ncbi:type II toxin-antitoxin system RelE/ParE family toxin [Cedecea neteri]|uniref:type II toxin-antitoxin system RelE/ParE family toxin n=1 Tax=Cedecea neteri TaxID=158822 RepID=UPI00289671A0|nr:type II toxin-antitoxin system RelE/ParE family toxin [Cedecea neteri]
MLYAAKRYVRPNGDVPYTDRIKKLRKKDPQSAAKIENQVARAMAGNFGDHKFEREGVWELKINYGQGFRVYYALESGAILLLLIAGDKKSQTADLHKAVDYLKEFKTRLKNDS